MKAKELLELQTQRGAKIADGGNYIVEKDRYCKYEI